MVHNYQVDGMSNDSMVADEESFISTFFVRALYDYQSNDPSSLSFRRDDIIEVLTRLDSGWWDGLLGEERGWFPSNYVNVISAQEAEATLGSLDSSTVYSSSEATDTEIDMAAALGDSGNESDWAGSGIDMERTAISNTRQAATAGKSATDFWVPQISADGQVSYINTQTGEVSTDLPHDHDEEMSESDMTSSLHSARTLNGFDGTRRENGREHAGFGVPKRAGTPEPWVRRLTDDGQTYFYYNKITGERKWTLLDTPVSGNGSNPFTSMASNSSVSLSTATSDTSADRHMMSRATSDTSPIRKDRDSVYSDGSDIMPNGADRSFGPTPLQRSIAEAKKNGAVNFSMAEQAAQALQEAMCPPMPQTVRDLTGEVQKAIGVVIDRARHADLWNPQQMASMTSCVTAVVKSVRNLLYIAALPSGTIPLDIMKDGSESRITAVQSVQAQLKPAQRKVTATLSKLVLSTRAYHSDVGTSPGDAASRLEQDALELDKALQAFVQDVQRYQRHSRLGTKRVFGAFSPDYLGLGVYGGGAAASWKGFGFVALNTEEDVPKQPFGVEAVVWLKQSADQLSAQITAFGDLLTNPEKVTDVLGLSFSRDIIRGFTSFLCYVADLHVAKHVDIDGIEEDAHQSSDHEMYMKTVIEARALVRVLEATTQAIYDDNASLLTAAQSLPVPGAHRSEDRYTCCFRIDGLLTSLSSNSDVVLKTLEKILRLGQRQGEMAAGEYRTSINNRMSKILTIEGTLRHSFNKPSHDFGYDDDVVNFENAFSSYPSQKRGRDFAPLSNGRMGNYDDSPSSTDYDSSKPPHWQDIAPSTESIDEADTTTLGPSVEEDSDDEFNPAPKLRKAKNLAGLLGDNIPTIHKDLAKPPPPSYLRPDYKEDEITMDLADGTVKAGTINALIEKLTAHDTTVDTKMIDTFMMTWKSFVSTDSLVEGLIKRFRLPPPPGLQEKELDEWRTQKLNIIRTRVLSRIKTLVQDEDNVLDKDEDQHIYAVLKAFMKSDDVKGTSGALSCLQTIERAERGENIKRTPVTMGQPPPPITPRNINKKMKLLDIDPLEMARQLTILEYQLFMKVQPMECILRSREQRAGKVDNISGLIQSTNLLATWVADCILSKEDSRRRAAVIKHFITVADKCLQLRNFNSMIALTAGLNQPAIRRLKRTWEQVNQRTMAALEMVEWTMHPEKNFNNYRETLKGVQPPCVPFFGVYLTQLTFIQDGNRDNVNGLINFSKRQMAAEVINDMKRWQTRAYSLTPIQNIMAFIEESLKSYPDNAESYKDLFWNLSLEREPREREDEKMARLLQESGFL